MVAVTDLAGLFGESEDGIRTKRREKLCCALNFGFCHISGYFAFAAFVLLRVNATDFKKFRVVLR